LRGFGVRYPSGYCLREAENKPRKFFEKV